MTQIFLIVCNLGDADKVVDSLPLYRASQDLPRIKLKHVDETLPESTLNAAPSSRRTPHARKRSNDHVPRPRNGFMIFRSDLCASGTITSSVENHHGEISRVAGFLWRSLSKDRKDFYMKKAFEEKNEHAKKYPDYRYSPRQKRDDVKRRKKLGESQSDNKHSKLVAELLAQGNSGKQLEKVLQNVDTGKSRSTSILTITIPPRVNAASSTKKRACRSDAKIFPSKRSKNTTSPSVPSEQPMTNNLSAPSINNLPKELSINNRRRSRSISVESEDEDEDEEDELENEEVSEDDNENDIEDELEVEANISLYLSDSQEAKAEADYPVRTYFMHLHYMKPSNS